GRQAAAQPRLNARRHRPTTPPDDTARRHRPPAAKESPSAMTVTVSMPQLGESVTEGTVTRWLKKEGERVEADEPLLEVSTDKVDTEIPSPAAGVLSRIVVHEDETAEVGSELAVIGGAGGAGGQAGGGQEQAAGAQAAARQAREQDAA